MPKTPTNKCRHHWKSTAGTSASSSSSENATPTEINTTTAAAVSPTTTHRKTRLEVATETAQHEHRRRVNGTLRKPKQFLTIHKKLLILDQVEGGGRYEDIENEFQVSKSTISKIMGNKNELRAMQKHFVSTGQSDRLRITKSMKHGKYPMVDKALYCWILQQRQEGIPVIGDVIAAKAVQFHKALYPRDQTDFKASCGYVSRFKTRCHLITKKINGEQFAADEGLAIEFAHTYQDKVSGYNDHQIFNCDETGLIYRMLPSRTVTCVAERANGWKKARERITVMFCANKSGLIRLPLLVIGKSNNPHCFRGINKSSLPVVYRHQTNAWMTSSLFKDWFWTEFVPYAMRKLRQQRVEQKLLLFLDNCSAHPHEDELNNISGTVKIQYLPPNTTSLIQPMDQGIIETCKQLYRHRLVTTLVKRPGVPLKDQLKDIHVLYAIQEIAHAWTMVKPYTLQRAWYNLTAPSDFLTQEDLHDDALNTVNSELQEHLQTLDISVTDVDISDWMHNDGPGVGVLTDEEIIHDILAGSNVNSDKSNTTHETETNDSDGDRKTPPSTTSTSLPTVLSWVNGVYTWFSQDDQTTMEQVKQITHLRAYVMARNRGETGEQAIDSFFPESPSKGK